MSAAAPSLRDFARRWLPPALREGFNRLTGNALHFSGDYRHWADAARQGRYDDAAILKQVIAAALAADGGNLLERDGQLLAPDEGQPDALVVALMAAARGNASGPLRVLDFGGALGSHWQASKRWQAALPPLEWRIVEQRHFVDAGREYLRRPGLHFHYSLSDALAVWDARPDLLIASSVLPYLEHPHREFAAFLAARPRWLLIDRTPFLEAGTDRLSLQTNPRARGGHRYPCWLFAPDAFAAECRKAGYRTLAHWPGSDGIHRVGGQRIHYRGCLLRLEGA